MQTERVTFLTTPDHKAALDAYAAREGKSVGHVLREASGQYLASSRPEDAELEMLVDQVQAALPGMQDDLNAIRASIADARASIAAALGQAR